MLAVDSFVIRASARRPDLAQRVIDFIRDGENAADASNLIGAGKPNAAALPDIEPRLAGERAIFPPAAERQRLEMLRDSEPRQRRLMSPLWTEIKVK